MLAEGVKGGFAMLYDTFANLETLGVCRRGYFLEGMGGAQFALPGAVERLRSSRAGSVGDGAQGGPSALVIAAADPAQPYGAALPWPKRADGERRPARVAGAYVVTISEQPVLYLERGGRGLLTLADARADTRETVAQALQALARRCVPDACQSSRWSGSTARRRSARSSPTRCSSSASIQARGGSRSAPERAQAPGARTHAV